MLDVRRLLLLRDLELLGTISAVARARSYSAAAVSQQLSTLERETGTKLLDRTGKRALLTPLGRALVAHADRILAELERAETTLSDGRGELSGTVRVAVFPSAARHVLPQALVRLSIRHPMVNLHVTEALPVVSLPRLRAGEFDVVLAHTYDLAPHDLPPDIEPTPLHTEPMLLARSASVPPPTAVADLSDVEWVADQPNSDCREVLVRLCGDAGFTPRIRHHTNDFAVAMALVAAGHSVALVPRLAVGTAPSGVSLGDVPGRLLRRRVWAATREGTAAHPLPTAMLTVLREAFAELAEPGNVTGDSTGK